MNPFRSASASIPSTPTLAALAIGLVLSLAGKPAFAQATIDHTKALAGNVTPGDAAGYPITISRPGHYKLMSNLTVPAGSKGIEATVPNVTLDLNGFTVSGPGSCTRSGFVVTCTGESGDSDGVEMRTASVVRNGTVQGFWRGIYIDGGSSVENVISRQNAGAGIIKRTQLTQTLKVSGSRAVLNGLSGMMLGGRGLVIDSEALLNGGYGIYGEAGAVRSTRVIASAAHGNGKGGFVFVTVSGSQSHGNQLESGLGTARSVVTSAGGNVDDDGVH